MRYVYNHDYIIDYTLSLSVGNKHHHQHCTSLRGRSAPVDLDWNTSDASIDNSIFFSKPKIEQDKTLHFITYRIYCYLNSITRDRRDNNHRLLST